MFPTMAKASLSPKQLATLLTWLDEAQRLILAMRDELIDAMAARRTTGTRKRTSRARRVRR